MTLSQFLKDTSYSRHKVVEGNLEIYVRRGKRILGDTDYDTLTIADISMVDMTEVDETLFTEWFNRAEVIALELNLSILFENVGGWPWMEKFLANRFFHRDAVMSSSDMQLDAYRVLKNKLTVYAEVRKYDKE